MTAPALKLCTGNLGKVREMERILGVPLVGVDAEIEEIQALDTVAVCRRKAEIAAATVGAPVLVDDTGFELTALSGYPGALVAWALKAGGGEILHRMLPPGAAPGAAVVTALGLATHAGVRIFSSRLEGHVVATPRGLNGFGFDAVFVPNGETRTLAELSDTEKDALSPRGLALGALARHLAEGGLE